MLRYWNPWVSAAGTVWGCYEPLGGGALLKEMCQREWTLRVYEFSPLPASSLCSLRVVEDVVSQLPTLGTLCNATSA